MSTDMVPFPRCNAEGFTFKLFEQHSMLSVQPVADALKAAVAQHMCSMKDTNIAILLLTVTPLSAGWRGW